jgi:hypothetical protein
MSRPLYSSLSSWSVLTLHIPCSTTGPYILLNIILSLALSHFISISSATAPLHYHTPLSFIIILIILAVFAGLT